MAKLEETPIKRYTNRKQNFKKEVEKQVQGQNSLQLLEEGGHFKGEGESIMPNAMQIDKE